MTLTYKDMYRQVNQYLLLLIAAIMISGCGSQKEMTGTLAEASKRKVIKSHLKTALPFKTLKARLGVKYKDGKRSQNLTMNMRMEKGKKIWISASVLGWTAAKVLITPEGVQFYEKLNKRKFEGDFRLIADFIGQDLNYEQIEQVFLGMAVEDLSPKAFTTTDTDYVFTANDVVKKVFRLRAEDFKVSQQAVYQNNKGDFLEIEYPSYQEVEQHLLPEEINISAKKGKRQSSLDMKLKSVELNKELSFPFTMPSGYRAINLR